MAQDKIQDALNLMIRSEKDELKRDDIIITMGRFAALKKDKIRGLPVSSETENEIRATVLELAQ